MIYADLDGLSRRLRALEGFSLLPTHAPKAPRAGPDPPPTAVRVPAGGRASTDFRPKPPDGPNGLGTSLSVEKRSAPKVQPAQPKSKINPIDPQKGQWGGRSLDGTWQVTAAVEQTSGNWFRTKLRVEAMPGVDSKITKFVKFHLHDSFDEPLQKGKLVNGGAELTFVSYGAFTVGVEISQDGSHLELDLALLDDAPRKFRER